MLWSVLILPAIFIGNATGLLTEPLGPGSRLVLEGAGVIGALLAARVMVRLADGSSFRSLGFARCKAVRELTLGVLSGALLVGSTVLVLWLPEWLEWRTDATISWQVLGLLGLVMMANSVTQEVLVRGYMFQVIEGESNSLVVLTITSGIFLPRSTPEQSPRRVFCLP